MRHLLLAGLLLVGCAVPRPEQPTSSASPPPAPVSETPEQPTPAAAPQPAASPKADPVDLTQRFLHRGLSNEARAQLLLQHLLASGQSRLMESWELYPLGQSRYDITYTVESMQRLTTPTPSSSPRRSSPFDTIPKRKTAGVRLTWTYDLTRSTCVAADTFTQSVMDLPPRLEFDRLVVAATPEPVVAAPLVNPPTLLSEEVETPPLPEVGIAATPWRVIGFVGEGRARQVAVLREGKTISLSPGQGLEGVVVKAISEDQVVLEYRGQAYPLSPGQEWSP